MKRSDRIRPIRDLAAAEEGEAGRDLAQARRLVQDHEQRLLQLQQYLDEYHAQTVPGLGPTDAVRLQNYSAFIDRLADAIRRQEQCVTEARDQLERSAETWRGRHLTTAALGNAIDRLGEDERRAHGRREQRDLDEVGQRALPSRED